MSVMRLADLSSGVTLGGRFRLLDILGRGSYGDVWSAEVMSDEDLPRIVALKVYHQPERATRVLLDEAARAEHFQHPRLVRVFGAARIDGLPVMWMEYVPGETLMKRLGNEEQPQPVSLADAMVWMCEMAEGLAYLHAYSPPWVHGDLKLDNVLLSETEGVRLADFGQSRTIEDRFVETAGTGAWPYLAPEIIGRHTEGIGRRFVSSDIYAFGVILYRMLTGRFPRRTMMEVLNQVPYLKPRELNSRIPVELENLVLRCLEKRPERRYQTGAELLASCRQFCDRLSAQASADMTPPAFAQPTVSGLADQVAEAARALLDTGHIEEALDQLELAMQRMSTAPSLLMVYAEAARRAGRLDAARAVYCRVKAYLQHRGCGDEELRDPVEGIAELDVQLKRYEGAVENFAWLVNRWPEKVWYQYRYGVALGLAGNYEASANVLKKVLESRPGSATVCSKIGLAYLQLRDAEQAAQYFNEALMLDEYEPHALFHLARIRWLQGRPDRAMIYLHRLREVEGATELADELTRLLGEHSDTGAMEENK
ncbi:MAG: serine/threonine-protein kinase [Acidobacteria bacterium]|nr:serine/threonine-protein kinase [Acidobacteriota bacterium]